MNQAPLGPSANDLVRTIELARAGDRDAFRELFEQFRGPLLARIRWMMGEEARRFAESSDFLQETFAAALPALPGFEVRGSDSFLRWLTTIARNRIRSDLRKHREEAVSALSGSLGGEANEVSVDVALSLMDALSKLDDDERHVVELHSLEGRTFVEIGARLGCSDRQAHRIHTRALVRLGRSLRGEV